jgi:hypothetical protein
MAAPLSRRERRILEVARRETDPRHASEFEPITRGPLVAVLALLVLGAASVPYMLAKWFVRIVRGRKSA